MSQPYPNYEPGDVLYRKTVEGNWIQYASVKNVDDGRFAANYVRQDKTKWQIRGGMGLKTIKPVV